MSIWCWWWRVASVGCALWLLYVVLSGSPAWLVLWNAGNLAACLWLLRATTEDAAS